MLSIEYLFVSGGFNQPKLNGQTIKKHNCTITTLSCLISVGYHLDLRIAVTFLWRVSFLAQITQVDSMHTKEYDRS